MTIKVLKAESNNSSRCKIGEARSIFSFNHKTYSKLRLCDSGVRDALGRQLVESIFKHTKSPDEEWFQVLKT